MPRYEHEDEDVQNHLDMRAQLGNLPEGGLSEQDIKRYLPSSMWGKLKDKKIVEKEQAEQKAMEQQYLQLGAPPTEEDVARDQSVDDYLSKLSGLQVPTAQPQPARPHYIGGWQKTPKGWRFVKSEDQ